MKLKEKLKTALDAAKRIAEVFEKDRVPVYAAQASFWMLFSVVPFTMLFIMAVGALSPIRTEDLTGILAQLLPAEFYSVVVRLLDEVLRQVNVPLFSFITVVLLWSVTLAFRSVGRGVQNIYGSENRPGTLRELGRSAIFVLSFLVTLIAAIVVLIFGQPVEELLHSYLDFVPSFVWFVVNFRFVIFLVFLTLLFALAYRYLARSEIPFVQQLPGAFVAALGWLIVSEVLSFYVGNFPRHTYIYGSLSVLLLAMMWLYYCMTIFMLGAELNKRRFFRKTRPTKPKSN